MPEARNPRSVRLAVAQTPVRDDPRDAEALRESGREVRALMREAGTRGARIVHFPEGSICFPDKLVLSVYGPDAVGPADWGRCQWPVLQSEPAAIAALARELRLWTVIASAHRLTGQHRPHNSLYVISDRGDVVTRYDERLLSKTKVSYLYSPGISPVTFDIDGVRFGCLIGMEIHYPELFAEYEKLDVDCVLLSTTGVSPGAASVQAQGHAAVNSYWVSFSVPTQHSATAPSGVIAPNGDWLERCPTDGTPSVAVVNLDDSSEAAVESVTHARAWRRESRAGVYAEHQVTDPRSQDRTTAFQRRSRIRGIRGYGRTPAPRTPRIRVVGVAGPAGAQPPRGRPAHCPDLGRWRVSPDLTTWRLWKGPSSRSVVMLPEGARKLVRPADSIDFLIQDATTKRQATAVRHDGPVRASAPRDLVMAAWIRCAPTGLVSALVTPSSWSIRSGGTKRRSSHSCCLPPASP
ncbi:carbon-nitrogen hydrolase family protein [Streptomyces sp. NPDC088928]|uniref:carbon-nitrogen hydrolase family protein n=1 Tax=Streptomyces sp. NPDC088928 TaxID=3365915 RepID=UPI0038085369